MKTNKEIAEENVENFEYWRYENRGSDTFERAERFKAKSKDHKKKCEEGVKSWKEKDGLEILFDYNDTIKFYEENNL